MRFSAATAIKLQCSRDYGFSDGETLRATDLSSLPAQGSNDLLTNSILSERNLSRFNRQARVAKSRNWRFKWENICKNMVLYKNKTDVKIDKMSWKLSILLSKGETCNIGQQEKLKARLQEKLKKSAKAKDYTKRLLQNCKSWGDLCTSEEELYDII